MSPEQARLVHIAKGEESVTSYYAGEIRVGTLFDSKPELPSLPYESAEKLVVDFAGVLEAWHRSRPALTAWKCEHTATIIYQTELEELEEATASLDIANPDQARAYGEEVADVIIATMLRLRHISHDQTERLELCEHIDQLASKLYRDTGLPLYALLTYKILVNHCNYPEDLLQTPDETGPLATLREIRGEYGGSLMANRQLLIGPWLRVYGDDHA